MSIHGIPSWESNGRLQGRGTLTPPVGRRGVFFRYRRTNPAKKYGNRVETPVFADRMALGTWRWGLRLALTACQARIPAVLWQGWRQAVYPDASNGSHIARVRWP